MRRLLIFVLYGIATVAFQGAFRLPADFLLFAVIFLAFFPEESLPRALLLTAFYGALTDTVSVSPFGMTLFAYGVVFAFVRLFRSIILFQSWPARFCWIFIFSLLGALAGWGYYYFISGLSFPFALLGRHLFLVPLANAAVGTIWINVLRRMSRLSLESFVETKDALLRR